MGALTCHSVIHFGFGWVEVGLLFLFAFLRHWSLYVGFPNCICRWISSLTLRGDRWTFPLTALSGCQLDTFAWYCSHPSLFIIACSFLTYLEAVSYNIVEVAAAAVRRIFISRVMSMPLSYLSAFLFTNSGANDIWCWIGSGCSLCVVDFLSYRVDLRLFLALTFPIDGRSQTIYVLQKLYM